MAAPEQKTQAEIGLMGAFSIGTGGIVGGGPTNTCLHLLRTIWRITAACAPTIRLLPNRPSLKKLFARGPRKRKNYRNR